jgi:hypothetical protein
VTTPDSLPKPHFHFVHKLNKVIKKNWFTGGMKINQSMPPTLKPGEQLWGIYFTDREYARVMGDPLRAVVAAPAKIAAEEAATRLGLMHWTAFAMLRQC